MPTATVVNHPAIPVPSTITLEGLTKPQAEIVMCCLRSMRTESATAKADKLAVIQALEAAGIARKGRLPVSPQGRIRESGPVRQFYVADEDAHGQAFTIREVSASRGAYDGDFSEDE